MDKKDVALAVLSVAVVALAVTVVYLTYQVRIPARGTIKSVNIGVYADANATIIVSEIDWGVIAPGGYSQAELYLKNTGNVPVNVSFTTGNWTPPPAEQYITLTWDLTNMTFNPNEVRHVTFTLTVASNITGIEDFAFDIIIEGKG